MNIWRPRRVALWLVFCSLLAACLNITLAQPCPAQSSVTIPDTPAGKQFTKWLTAFNSGKRDTLRQFIAENFDAPPNGSLPIDDITNQQSSLFKTTGGFEPQKVTASSSAMVAVLAKAKRTGYWMQLSVYITAEPPDFVTAKAPYKLVGFGVSNREAPVELLPQKKMTEKEIRENLNTLMTTLVASDDFSGTIYLAKDGKPLYAKAFGLANKTWNIPNRIDTKFNLASITKMFTAVAVAQLVEQGKLAYTDTVGKVLPEYPNKEVAQKVTIHHLLSHTSGMIGARTLVEKGSGPPTMRTIGEMVKHFSAEPLSFPPGQQFDYSNAGFILLGAVIEKASRQTYYDYVREHIFKPAGMTNTDFYELDTDPPNLAVGFKDGPNGTRLNNMFDLGVIGSPAGGAYSTGEDMTKFHMALTNHTLLKEQSLKTLWTGVTEEPDQNTEYGYGAQITHYNGTQIIGHGGGWQGITNHFDMYPELGYTVVILSNYDDDPNSIANKLHEWLTQGITVAESPKITPPTLKISAEISGTTVAKATPVHITVSVTNTGGTAHASIIDMEVKDANGAKVNQQFSTGQKIQANQTRTYTYAWTPTTAGNYTIDIGAFGPGWRTKYLFEAGVATITVN